MTSKQATLFIAYIALESESAAAQKMQTSQSRRFPSGQVVLVVACLRLLEHRHLFVYAVPALVSQLADLIMSHHAVVTSTFGGQVVVMP